MSHGHGDHGHSHGHAHGAAPHEHGRVPAGDLARGAGRGLLLFVDAFSGIAGDMFVAALIDLGVPAQVMDHALSHLPLEGYRIELSRKSRSGIDALKLDVHLTGAQAPRHYRQIREMLEAADLPGKDLALRAFRLLAEAEAEVHGMAIDDVHFHEVGAVDSIVDIVAAAAALDHLGAEVVCSPLPMGRGTVRAAHGVLPLPAPATVRCLRGVPTIDAGIDVELVTPTGACLIASVAKRFSRWPAMRPQRIGWGSGTRDLPDRPNLLRLVLGEPDTSEEVISQFVVLEANVDDTTPEVIAYALEQLRATGALDAWATPITMKKGRPAVMVSALARRGAHEAVARTLLAETSSLGVRVRSSERIERPRRMVDVDTEYGTIAVKIADGDGIPPNFAPEYEACRAIAAERDVPLKEVYAAALAAARASHGTNS